MIKRLFLQHWKSHDKTELRFDRGANLLIGGMGTGKSSCLDAICYAFFGSFPALKSRRVSLQDVITRGKDFCRVELEFEDEGKNYIVSRSFGSKTSKAELRADDEVIETQSQRISEFVERILKLDYELFTRAVYSEQNRIEYFLDLPRGERKRQLDYLIGISAFETVRANASSLVNKLKSNKGEFDFLNAFDYEELKARHESELRGVKQIKKEFTERERRRSILSEQSSEMKTKIDELEKKREEHAKNIEQKTSLKSQLSFIENRLAETPEYEHKEVDKEKNEVEELKGLVERKQELEKSLSELNGRIVTFKKEEIDESVLEKLEIKEKNRKEKEALIEKLQSQSASLQEKNRIKTQEAEKLRREIDKISKEKPELEELKKKIELKARQLGEKEREQEIAKLKITENMKVIELLKNALGKCPTCGEELTEEHRLKALEEKTKDLEQLREKQKTLDCKDDRLSLGNMEERRNSLQADCNLEEEKKALLKSISSDIAQSELDKLKLSIEEEKKSLFKLNEEISVLTNQKFKLEKQRVEEKKTNEAIEKKKTVEEDLRKIKSVSVDELKRRMNALNKLLEAESLRKEKKEKAEKLKDVESLIEKLGFEEDKLKEAEEKISKIREELAENTAFIEGLKQRLIDKDNVIETLEKQRSMIEQKMKQLKLVNNKIEKAVQFEDLIISLQTNLREELVQALNEVLETVWKEIYPYNDYSSIVIVPSENDYSVKLKGDVLVDADDVSGGERTCAAIALRVALAVTLAPSLKWIIFDEPTHNLDVNATRLLSNAFKEGISSITSQVFIITHDETLKSGFDSYYLFDRSKEDNGSSVVEKVKES